MATFSLVPYSIRLRKSGDSEHYLKLGKDFNEARIDLLDFMDNFLSSDIPSLTQYAQHLNEQQQAQAQGQQTENTQEKQIFVVDEIHREGSLINGRFRVGGYGYSAPLLDIQTGDIAHTKSTLEAELTLTIF